MSGAKHYVCRDCKRVVPSERRLRMTVRIYAKSYLEDPKCEAGWKDKTVYKCPYCRGRIESNYAK